MSNNTFDYSGFTTMEPWEPFSFDNRETRRETMPTTEMVFYTVPSQFLNSTGYDRKEKDFLSTLCFYLEIKIANKDDIDSMKEAVNNYILNQINDWMKETDPVTIECILNNSFKRLCEAGNFISDREGTKQIYWQDVIENHVKLIASYVHVLSITRTRYS